MQGLPIRADLQGKIPAELIHCRLSPTLSHHIWKSAVPWFMSYKWKHHTSSYIVWDLFCFVLYTEVTVDQAD